MPSELVKELIGAGIHFGHRVGRWNPKMQPYIFGKRNLIHIINVKETIKGIILAKKFLQQVVADGKDLLFVGTKRQARKAVQEHATAVGMHWVTDRWLGGTLTNLREIRKRVGRLEELEELESQGLLDTYSKKEGAALRREMRKIRRNLQGVRRMERLPGALVLIDQRREINAVLEAKKLSIPVVCLLDTDSNPDLVDIPIPGNDDAMRAIDLVVKQLCEAVTVGKQLSQKAAAEPETRRRRSRRPATARASQPEAPEPGAAPAEEQPPAAQEPAGPVQLGESAETPGEEAPAKTPGGEGEPGEKVE